MKILVTYKSKTDFYCNRDGLFFIDTVKGIDGKQNTWKRQD